MHVGQAVRGTIAFGLAVVLRRSDRLFHFGEAGPRPAATSRAKMLPPSACNDGFCVDDDGCPLFLGNGFGPPVYHELYGIWDETTKHDMKWFEENHPTAVSAVKALVKVMRPMKAENLHEGVLSSLISKNIQKLIPILDSTLSNAFAAVHQLFVPDKSGVRVDIAITDAQNDDVCVHSLVEIEWIKDNSKFPEMEASACSSRFRTAGASRHSWMPIFVLSKNHFQIGVAFDGIESRWAYSEIFEYRSDSFFDDKDVIHLLRFFLHMVRSSGHHRSCINPDVKQCLFDKTGTVIISSPEAIGDRVLKGFGGTTGKVFKFYANRADAVDALQRQEAVFTLLGLNFVAVLKEGYSNDGVHAVIDDYLVNYPPVTNGHLKNLVRIIQTLFKNGMVHGDLRLPNILFGERDEVNLIDFEWAGPKGTTLFPVNVCKESFGPQASKKIRPGMPIPDDFDCHCLFDILCHMHCTATARRALNYDFDGALSQLDVETGGSGHEARNILPNEGIKLNLRRLGFNFYEKSFTSNVLKRQRDRRSSELAPPPSKFPS